MAVVTADRVQPHNLDAERAVLGAIIVNNAAWSKVASIVKAVDFFRVGHQRLFSAMERLVAAGAPIDFMLLREELHKAGDEDEVGGPAYIAALIDGSMKSTNVEFYAKLVLDKSKLRQTIQTATKMLSRAYEEEPTSEIVETSVRELMQIEQSTARGAVSLGAALKEYTSDLDSARGKMIPSGFIDLDDVTGGIERKKLTIVAARPSVGKTSLLMALADHVTASAVPTVVFTLETDPSALASGLLAAHSGVSSDRMRRKTVEERGWSKIAHAMEALDGRPMYFVQDAYTLTSVQAWTRRLVEEYGVQLVGLDYIQLMGEQQSKDRQNEIAYISRSLKRLAIDLDIAMVALSQLSRAPEGRTDKRPHLSDLRESGALEQDADLVLLLFREEMYKKTEQNAGIAEVIIAKNKQGPVGTAKLAFIHDTARFQNLAREGFQY